VRPPLHVAEVSNVKSKDKSKDRSKDRSKDAPSTFTIGRRVECGAET